MIHSFKIANVVACTNVGEKLSLENIIASLKNCEYEPEQYFALIYRIIDPKLSILVNKSGKIIFTGAKSSNDIEAARRTFFDDLISLGYAPRLNKIIIQNIVVVAHFESKLNLLDICKFNSNEDIEISQKKINIIVKNKIPKYTAIIFKTGSILIAGLKEFNHIEVALDQIEKLIN